MILTYPKTVYVFVCQTRVQHREEYALPYHYYALCGFSLDPNGGNLPRMPKDWVYAKTILPKIRWNLNLNKETVEIIHVMDTEGWCVRDICLRARKYKHRNWRPFPSITGVVSSA